MITPRPGILDIAPYVPGRAEAGDGFAGRLIKLSSNEAALGPSPRAVAAYHEVGERLHRYPDGGASALRARLAAHHGLDAARIVCGNGSDEILALIARAYAGPGDEVLYSRYGFLVYPIAALGAGATPVAAPERELRADVDALIAAAGARTRVCFLANPNNPTGSYLARDEVARLRAGLPDHVLLVIDAAYAEFVEAADYGTAFDLVDGADNVVVARTFSKIYGLAGLRLGWAYAPSAVADVLNRIRGPFNVNAAALAAGEAALADTAHTLKAQRHNQRWLTWLTERLRALGLTVYPSVANFVLVRFADAAAANAFLLARGIVVRTMEAYGLPDCLRITIGTGEEMEAVAAALAEFTA